MSHAKHHWNILRYFVDWFNDHRSAKNFLQIFYVQMSPFQSGMDWGVMDLYRPPTIFGHGPKARQWMWNSKYLLYLFHSHDLIEIGGGSRGGRCTCTGWWWRIITWMIQCFEFFKFTLGSLGPSYLCWFIFFFFYNSGGFGKIGLRFIGLVKTATKKFPMAYLDYIEIEGQGDWKFLSNLDDDTQRDEMMAVLWVKKSLLFCWQQWRNGSHGTNIQDSLKPSQWRTECWAWPCWYGDIS